jgi:hypothetical protein
VNPFASEDWLNNTSNFSPKRQAAVDSLFGDNLSVRISEIRKRTQNVGRYAAFRAIAHGIAVWN